MKDIETRVINYDLGTNISRCLRCGICSKHCPLGILMGDVIKLYRENNIRGACQYIFDTHPFPYICSYICPDHFCMEHCPTNIDIKWFRQFFLQDKIRRKKPIEKNGKHIAIIGGGVSGLTCAWYLYQKGYTIDLYEKNKLGGELNLIPKDRLPKSVLSYEIEDLKQYIDNLILDEFDRDCVNEYDKVIYCIGMKPKVLSWKVDPDDSLELIPYNEHLSSPYEGDLGIIGGGNVALDCAIHNKGHSTIFVRRNYWDMRINKKDFKTMIDKNIKIVDNFTPIGIFDGKLIGYYYDNTISFKFDRIVTAIGREPIELANLSSNEVQIIPDKSAIETIAKTIKELKGMNL